MRFFQNPDADPLVMEIEPEVVGPLAPADFVLFPDGHIRAATANAQGLFIFDSKDTQARLIPFPNELGIDAASAEINHSGAANHVQISADGSHISVYAGGSTNVFDLTNMNQKLRSH